MAPDVRGPGWISCCCSTNGEKRNPGGPADRRFTLDTLIQRPLAPPPLPSPAPLGYCNRRQFLHRVTVYRLSLRLKITAQMGFLKSASKVEMLDGGCNEGICDYEGIPDTFHGLQRSNVGVLDFSET